MNSPSTLSSLHFLTEANARPKSKGKDNTKPAEEKRDEHAGAFKDFKDYSTMNETRHNAARSDTFKTAAAQAPSRKKTAPLKIAGEDFSSMNSAYLISAIRSDVRQIGQEFRAELHDEAQQSLAQVRKEVRATLDVIGDTSESTIGVVMTKLKEDIHKILSDAGWPLKVDFTPMQDEIRIAAEAQANNYRQQMQQLADRLGEKIAPLSKELLALRGLHDQLNSDFEKAHKRISDGIRAPVADMAQTLQRVHDVQQEYTEKNANLEQRLEAHVIKNVFERPVNVDFAAVLNCLGESRQGTSSDFRRMHSGLDKMQKDVAQVRVELAQVGEMKKTKEEAPKKEMDSQWVQTDAKEMTHGFAQTDDQFWKAKVVQKAKEDEPEKLSPEQTKRTQRASQVAKKAQKGNGVFVDADAMKKKVRAALIKTPYNVFDYYYMHGICQKITRSQLFENVTFAVVFLNALWISIDADYNNADILIKAHPVFIVAENAFCFYFTVELTLRLLSFRKKKYCIRDPWFVFDLVLVSLMVFETWVMSVIFLVIGSADSGGNIIDASVLRLIRIVKILRLSRLARLMRAVPEIIIFLKGIGAASRSVASLFGLWLIIIYVFAVFFAQTAEGDLKEAEFLNVPSSMNTLLLQGIFPDNSKLVYNTSADNPIFWPIIVFFVLLASITLSYMLIGVLVQIVQVIAGTEKERAVVGIVANHLRKEWQDKGHDMETLLSKHEFQQLLVEPAIALFLQDVGVDMLVLVDMAEMIYDDIAKEHRGISFEHFVDAVLNMRGTNPVTVQDVKSQLRIMKRMIKESVTKLEVKLNSQFDKSNKMINNVRLCVLGDQESDVPDVHSEDDASSDRTSKAS